MKILINLNLTMVLVLVSLLLFAYVIVFTPAVPMSDQWELVPFLQNASVSDLWAQHNEHRIFIPKIIFLTLARMSHWNIRWETAASWLFFSSLMLLIWKKFSSYPYDSASKALFLSALIAQTSPIHHENLLWGWQLQIILCVLAVFIAFMNVERAGKEIVPLINMTIALSVAAFSFMSGLFAWVICLTSVIWARRYKLFNIILLALTAAAAFLMFFKGYVLPLSEHGQHSVASRIYLVISYFLVYLGANFVPTYKAGRFIGPLLMMTGVWGIILFVLGGMLVYRTYKYDKSMIIMPYSMIGFGLLTAAATSIGRAAYGLEYALLSRYHIFQMFYFIGLIWLLIVYMEQSGNMQNLRRLLTGSMLILAVFGWIGGLALGVVKIQRLSVVEKDLMENGAQISSGSARILSHDEQALKKNISVLMELKYNVFAK